MRNVAFTLLALALTPATLPAQGWAEKLFKDGITHDFGTVARGGVLYHRFPLTNIYAVPLDITNVQSSCGCGSANPSAKTLQPRETGYIEVSMDARKFTGPKTIKVSVTVGPQFISTAELSVSANSRADVVLNPGHLNFGTIPQGETPTQTIDVEYAGALDWRAKDVVNNGLPATVVFKELYRRPGQVGYQVSVKLKADAPAGMLKQDIFLKTNDPATPLLPLLVEANVQAALSVRPEVLNFGALKVGDTKLMKIQISGQKPFRVLAVDGLGDGVTLELPAAPELVHVLTVQYQPAKAGEFQRQLKIKTDLQDTPVNVKVDAVVAP